MVLALIFKMVDKMKYIKIIVATLALLSLFSCEENVSNPELPYKEQLVIQAYIYADSSAKNIKITRTLHPLDHYTFEKALVSDADAYIIDEGVKYKLYFNSNSNTYYNSNIKFKQGQKYQLEVNWKNLKASSSTIIPESYNYNLTYNKKTDVSMGMKEYDIIVEFSPNKNYAYNGGKLYYDSYYKKLMFYTQTTYDNSYIKNGKISMSLDNRFFPYHYTDQQILDQLSNSSFYITVFDYAYYKYYLSQYNGGSSGDVFGTNGNNTDWNIVGDGIGLFVGGNIKFLKF